MTVTTKITAFLTFLMLASCVAPGTASSNSLGERPTRWTGGDYTKKGRKLGSIWVSDDKSVFVQQVKFGRDPDDGPEDWINLARSGHSIDSVKRYRLSAFDVLDVRCRPLPKTSDLAEYTRILYFMGTTSVDSILFSGVSKASMNCPEFQRMYSRLGVGPY